MSSVNSPLRVSCALIFKENLIFAAQRGPNKSMPELWEFPGGKIEANESVECSIIRELREELDLNVLTSEVCQSFFYDYDGFEIELIPVVCHLENFDYSLNEHVQVGWFDERTALTLNWCPADIQVMEFVFNRIREEI